MRNCASEESNITGAMILELCHSHETVRQLIPDGFELMLPRFRLETLNVMTTISGNTNRRWAVECWWRSVVNGTLGYYIKIDLFDKSLLEFRELPGDITVPGMNIGDAEMAYLDRGGMSLELGPDSGETAAILDELWKSLVPDELREYAFRKAKGHTIGSYLLPVESLACWNWETLRDLLLKRENTTIERILDYVEYQKSGSDKPYIAPEDRAEAKVRGMKFWRGDDDL